MEISSLEIGARSRLEIEVRSPLEIEARSQRIELSMQGRRARAAHLLGQSYPGARRLALRLQPGLGLRLGFGLGLASHRRVLALSFASPSASSSPCWSIPATPVEVRPVLAPWPSKKVKTCT